MRVSGIGHFNSVTNFIFNDGQKFKISNYQYYLKRIELHKEVWVAGKVLSHYPEKVLQISDLKALYDPKNS